MKLLKSISGLPDSPMKLLQNDRPVPLVDIKCQTLTSDTCRYSYTTKKEVIIILPLYVDNLLLCGGDTVLLVMPKKKQTSGFQRTDVGKYYSSSACKSSPTAKEAS